MLMRLGYNHGKNSHGAALPQVGSEVTGVQKGGRVIGLQSTGSGGFAEEIVTNASVSFQGLGSGLAFDGLSVGNADFQHGVRLLEWVSGSIYHFHTEFPSAMLANEGVCQMLMYATTKGIPTS